MGARRNLQSFGTVVVGIPKVKNHLLSFEKGEFEQDDKPRSGRPKRMSCKNCRVRDVAQSIRELTRHLNIDHFI